ncbi:MAG: M28 family peptidase [Acidobacteria bacterium]|nr:M28 family peptidase [Acidobacteriota bacterium]
MKLITGVLFGLAICSLMMNGTITAQKAKVYSERTPTTFERPSLVKKYQKTISPEFLASHLGFLASDFFEGRGTGTRGQRMAAEYLASQYRQMGLSPKGNAQPSPMSPKHYLQSFSLYQVRPKETRLEIVANGNKVSESIFSDGKHDDLSFYKGGGVTDASGGVVFVGYGIADDALEFNEFAALSAKGISIEGKWLIMLADEPLSDAETSLLPTDGNKISRWTTGFVEKRVARWNAGRPKGILVVSDLSPRNKSAFAEATATAALSFQLRGPLSYFQPEQIPPTFNISAKFANQILASSGQRIENVKQQIDQSLLPKVFEVKDVAVISKAVQSPKLDTENVLAFIEGSDPKLKDEVIVISAHYDHLGIDPQLKGDQIFNGAADDGTGTVATLALAAAFMQAKRDGFAPRRSILFANFTAEETGLLGSFYYTNVDPRIPLEKTVANVNMDGVGGTDLKNPTGSRDYVYITGARNLSEELIEINGRIKTVTGSTLNLTDGASFGFASDDRHFRGQLIPYIYYSTGRTEYYHTVGDTPETIDYEHFARVVQLIFANTWQVANQQSRITSVDRSKLKVNGYACEECGLECDLETRKRPLAEPGVCPVCGMNLVPNYVLSK